MEENASPLPAIIVTTIHTAADLTFHSDKAMATRRNLLSSPLASRLKLKRPWIRWFSFLDDRGSRSGQRKFPFWRHWQFVVCLLVPLVILLAVTLSIDSNPERSSLLVTKFGGFNTQLNNSHAPSSRLAKDQSCKWQGLYHRGFREGVRRERHLAWDPQPDRFLFMHCELGQVNNRITCMRHHMIMSALLNRTLIMPLHASEVPIGFNLRVVFDPHSFRHCIGNATVLTTREFVQKYNSIVVDHILCWAKNGCPESKSVAKSEFLSQVPNLQFSPTLERETLRLPNTITLKQFLKHYGSVKARILIMGDLFYQQLSDVPGLYISGTIPFNRSSKCDLIPDLQPHPAVMQAAKLFIREKIRTQNFGAVHLKLGPEFHYECRKKGKQCYYPTAQATECIRHKVVMGRGSTLFLATDGNQTEIDEFIAGVDRIGNRTLTVVRLNTSGKMENESWAAPLRDSGLGVRGLPLATVSKTVCALATIFQGSAKSSFSADIERLRYGFGTASCSDGVVCYGDKPKETQSLDVIKKMSVEAHARTRGKE